MDLRYKTHPGPTRIKKWGDFMNGNTNEKLSWIEGVSVLTVSQIFSTIAFSTSELSGASTILSFVFGTALNFLIILPFLLLCKKQGYRSLIELSRDGLGVFSYVVSFLFLGILLAVTVSTAATFEDFLSKSVFEDSSPFIIVSLLILAASYGAFLGIEALGRFANIVFVLVSISVLIILFSVLENVKLTNLGSTSLQDTEEIVKTGVEGLFSNTGLITAVLIAPLINDKRTKGFTVWNVASLIIVIIIVFSVYGVLGNYAFGKEYPYYDTATTAEFSIVKRLDIVYMCVWVFVAFIKTTYYLLLSKRVLDTVLHKKAKKYSLFFCSALSLGLSFIASVKEIFHEYLKFYISSGITLILLLVVLPIILLLKRRKKYEKT